MERKGVPTPPYSLADNLNTALREASRIGYPVVIKPYAGSFGNLVAKARGEEELSSIVELLSAQPCFHNRIWMLQRYIEKPGRDIRVVVVGGEPSACYYRIAKHWITNVHRGAKREVCNDKEAMEIAVKAAEAIGEGIFGVDIAESREGYFVLEVNHKPGLPSLGGLGRKVARAISDYVISKAKR